MQKIIFLLLKKNPESAQLWSELTQTSVLFRQISASDIFRRRRSWSTKKFKVLDLTIFVIKNNDIPKISFTKRKYNFLFLLTGNFLLKSYLLFKAFRPPRKAIYFHFFQIFIFTFQFLRPKHDSRVKLTSFFTWRTIKTTLECMENTINN